MAIAYAEIETIKRTPTTNLLAGLAYMLRGRFIDGNSGKVYDFRKIDDPPEYSATFMPPNSRYQNESELWSDAERLERRHDSRLGRRLILALPAEVSPEERQQIVEKIAEKIVDRYRCALTAAVHRPGKQGDQRNFHAHFLISTRMFNQEGFLKEKIRVLDNPRTSRGEIEWIRQTCQEQINKFLSPEQQLDFRSYKRQGKDRPAQPHYGRKVIAWERKTGEKHEVRLEYEQFVNSWNRQRELERQAEQEKLRQEQEELAKEKYLLEQSKQEEQQKQELERRRLEQERQRQQQEQKRQAEREKLRREQEELNKKYRFFYVTKKLVNLVNNPLIGLDTERNIILPDKTLKLSELKDYSLDFLEQSFLRVRRQVEADLSRRISQLPPEMRGLLTRPVAEIEKMENLDLIGLITEVRSLETLAQEEQERQREEQKRRQEKRQRAEQEKLQQGQGLPKKERLREKLERRRENQEEGKPNQNSINSPIRKYRSRPPDLEWG